MSTQPSFYVLSVLASALSSSFASLQGMTTQNPPSQYSEIDSLVKIIGGIVAGLATLIGLPIVFLTYKKTRAEITKLELEAAALREKQSAQSFDGQSEQEGTIRIVVDNSPNTTIEVLADPRFLAPLLILLDFIFAWIILSLADHLLSLFAESIRTVLLMLLSGALLLPIARQVLRVRTVINPPRTPDEVHRSTKQARVVGYLIYSILLSSSLVFGSVLYFQENLTTFGRYLSRLSIISGILMAAGAPLLKRQFDKYLIRTQLDI